MKSHLLAIHLAVAALSNLLAAQPQPPQQGGQPPRPEDSRVFYQVQTLRAIENKADLLLEMGKTDMALEEFKRAFSVDIPRDEPAFEVKAHVIGKFAITLTNMDRKKEAVETIQKLLAQVAPGSVAEATAWLNAGTVYRQSGMPEEALKAFDRAIELSQKLARSPGPGGRPGPPLPPGGRPPRQQPPTSKTP